MITIKGLTTAEIKAIVSNENSPSVKKYFTYDGAGNVVDAYYAQNMTVSSGICLRQHFTYVTISGTECVQKEIWTDSNWDSAWDTPAL